MTNQQPAEAFGRAYVACGYLLGLRGRELVRGLESSPALESLCQRLAKPERNQRALALAAELSMVVRSLLEQRLK